MQTKRLRAGVLIKSEIEDRAFLFGYLTHPGLEYEVAIAIPEHAISSFEVTNKTLINSEEDPGGERTRIHWGEGPGQVSIMNTIPNRIRAIAETARYARLSFASHRDELAEALRRLARLLGRPVPAGLGT